MESTLLGMVVAAALFWLVGTSFIDSFFERKEEMMNRMLYPEEKGDE